MNKQQGFDIRFEDYNEIHNNTKFDWNAFVDAINPKNGDIILDGCGGYGDVSEHLIQRNKKSFIWIVDSSHEQLSRLDKRIKEGVRKIICADIRETGLPNELFDTCVIKMGIHEVSKEEQLIIFKEMFRILKPRGKLVIWELALNENSQLPFQKFIRKKDELSGFTYLTEQRYFPRFDELLSLFKKTGFIKVLDVYTKEYKPSVLKRLHELVSKERHDLLKQKKELSEYDIRKLDELSVRKAEELKEYARKIFRNTSEELEFTDSGKDIEFIVEKKIMVGYKPERRK